MPSWYYHFSLFISCKCPIVQGQTKNENLNIQGVGGFVVIELKKDNIFKKQNLEGVWWVVGIDIYTDMPLYFPWRPFPPERVCIEQQRGRHSLKPFWAQLIWGVC